MAIGRIFKGQSHQAEQVVRTVDPSLFPEQQPDSFRTEILDQFEQAGIGWIWATDASGNMSYLTKQALTSLACSEDSILGNPLESIFQVSEDNPDRQSSRSLKLHVKGRKPIREEIVQVSLPENSRFKQRIWWSISGTPVYTASDEFDGYRGSAKDVTREFERKISEVQLAEFDPLTGLANRHNMERQLTSTLSAYKASGRNCAVMVLDLDKFKRVNDTMGHQAGDVLLRQVAERLSSVVAKHGLIARMGGDEFQILLADQDDRGMLGELAEKIIQLLSQPYPLDEGKRAVIGASVGIALAPHDGDEPDSLIRCADLALYAAKKSGRGQFRFYSSDLKDEEEVRQSMLDDLRVALEDGQLALHYQPVVSIATGHVVCLEALLRWTHPTQGNIRPGRFIPVAEDSDLINNIGEWVLRTACEAASHWPKNLRVAVNVSAVQFANPSFPTVVANTLAHTGIAPDRVELELTESIFLGDSDETEAQFKRLKGLGVRIALDDFGTGYSSLCYLRSAPFDKIKVDKSFVDSCTQQDKNSAKIIAAIVGLSNALDMETTVEGVEAFDQLEVVKSKGAKLVQGFIYSHPMPIEEIVEHIKSGEFKIKPSGPETFKPDRRTVFRRVGVIHENYYYNAVMRDLSRKGAGLEGILGLEPGVDLVLDMGDGQLVVCTVVEVNNGEFSVEFETSLVSDGTGGLCTRHRISRQMIVAAGLPKKPGTATEQEGKRSEAVPHFMEVNR